MSMIMKSEIYDRANGVKDWEWGRSTSYDGFIDWLYVNTPSDDISRGLDANDQGNDAAFDSWLRQYLESAGENPSDYLGAIKE